MRWIHHYDSDTMQLINEGGAVIQSARRWTETERRLVMIAMSKAARQDGWEREEGA